MGNHFRIDFESILNLNVFVVFFALNWMDGKKMSAKYSIIPEMDKVCYRIASQFTLVSGDNLNQRPCRHGQELTMSS